MLKRLIITIAVLGQAVIQGLGQGTNADYKRAAEIRERFSGKVYNEKIHALIKADKDFEFIMVPGAGHGAGESKYAARRRMDFLLGVCLG